VRRRACVQVPLFPLFTLNKLTHKHPQNKNREAFPASSSPQDRTTYLFHYCTAEPERPSLLECFEDYWDLLPGYQDVNLDELTFKRAVCNFFPTYKDSPLKTDFDRLCAIGDGECMDVCVYVCVILRACVSLFFSLY
jgi:hypothetical protein